MAKGGGTCRAGEEGAARRSFRNLHSWVPPREAFDEAGDEGEVRACAQALVTLSRRRGEEGDTRVLGCFPRSGWKAGGRETGKAYRFLTNPSGSYLRLVRKQRARQTRILQALGKTIQAEEQRTFMHGGVLIIRRSCATNESAAAQATSSKA